MLEMMFDEETRTDPIALQTDQCHQKQGTSPSALKMLWYATDYLNNGIRK